MARKKSLADFLSGLDTSTGEKPAPSVQNLSDAQIAKGLSEVKQSGIGLSNLSIAGATPKQTQEAKAALEAGYSSKDVAKDIFPKAAPKKQETQAQKQSDATKAYEQQIQQVQNNPWTQMANSLANEAQSVFQQINPAASGSTGAQAQTDAANQALSSLGLSSGSSAGQWLKSQTQAAQATAAPVNAAMQAEGAQYAAEQGPITKAIQNWGEANAIQTMTAPESSWLNALASHVTSNLSYYGVVPTAALPSLSPDVAQALQASGGYGGTTGAGTVPIQNIVPSGTGGSKTGLKAPAGNAGAALAGAATGAIPTPSVAPSG